MERQAAVGGPGTDEALGLYLCCFTRSEAAAGLGLAGVDGTGRLEALAVDGVAAVFCRVPVAAFAAPSSDDARGDPGWLIACVCRHKEIVEAVRARSAVLPVRLGAVFSSPQALGEFLGRHHAAIGRFLDDMADKEEWAVKVFLDAERAGEWLCASDPSLATRRERLPQGPGARYLAEKQLQADLQRQVRSWSRGLGAQVQDELAVLAVQALRLPLRATSAEDGEMVGNGAFLLVRPSVSLFRERVHALQGELLDRGIALASSGPWPPYSFCPPLEGPSP